MHERGPDVDPPFLRFDGVTIPWVGAKLFRPSALTSRGASLSALVQAILLAARSFRASDLFAGIVLLGSIGFLSNALLAVAEKNLLRWQHP